jgi:anti-sigma-K factor RskA
MPLKNHSPFIENIPAYALGALDTKDASALDAHLKTCASCRDELAAYSAVSNSLLTAIPPKNPPASLRRQLQSKLPSARRLSHQPIKWPWSQFAWAMALAALLLLNAVSFLQMQSFQRQQIQLSHQLQSQQTALALLSYSGVKTLPINTDGISGTLLFDKDRNAVAFFAWDLPQLPDNQTYQAWLIDSKEERTSLGTFRPDPSLPFTSFSIISPNDLSNFVGIGVTVEPSGGSSQPTGARLFRVNF